LWSHGLIDATRVTVVPELTRIVVAIDPAAGSGDGSDETGIVVAGKDVGGHGYVLADLSGRHPPTEWARVAVAAWHAHHADRIVAEINNGGGNGGATLRGIAPDVPVTAVPARPGQGPAAEPGGAPYGAGGAAQPRAV